MTAPERTALVLQGGGALGAYQAGAYEALCAAGHVPEWVAGVSIGAINAAIIAGNPPEDRAPKLRRFWDLVSAGPQSGNPLAALVPESLAGEWGTGAWGTGAWGAGGWGAGPWGESVGRMLFNEANAGLAATFGIPGFFRPRVPPPVLQMPGDEGALSWYDTAPLRETLEELVDFRLLNGDGPRISVGAVNVATGNNFYFDSTDMHIGPEHVMASGALPPGFAPVMIDGDAWWDGGLVSNTPLRHVLDQDTGQDDLCIFQVDLFSAVGALPETLLDVEQRTKDIRYSSRTRLNTDLFRQLQDLRQAGRELYDALPPKLQKHPAAKKLREEACEGAITIVHLIYRQPPYATHSKDYEFSRQSISEHWEAGRADVEASLAHEDWINHTRPTAGVTVLDLTKERRAARGQRAAAGGKD